MNAALGTWIHNGSEKTLLHYCLSISLNSHAEFTLQCVLLLYLFPMSRPVYLASYCFFPLTVYTMHATQQKDQSIKLTCLNKWVRLPLCVSLYIYVTDSTWQSFVATILGGKERFFFRRLKRIYTYTHAVLWWRHWIMEKLFTVTFFEFHLFFG